MTAPLLPALPLIEGETLTGYVSRSAKLYETTPRDFCTDLGMRWPYLCSGHEDQIERLAWIINKRPEEVTALAAGKVGNGRFKLGQTVATFGTFRRTAARFCPKCVTNAMSNTGPYGVFQMQEWAITCLQICPQHNCYFITLPPAKHSHKNYDFVTRILENMDTVHSAGKCPKTVPQTPFERYIRRRVWRGPKDDWLQQLDLTQIHRLCLNLGAALEGLNMQDLMALTNKQDHRLSQIGFKVFSAGPEEFKSALKRLHRQSTTERPYYSSDMGPFYQWLREFYDDPDLEPIVDLTCTHIFETYPTPMGKEVFNRVAPKQIWLSMNEARKKVGVTAVFLRKLLGHMNGLDETEAILRTDVHVDELAKAKAYWETLLNLDSAASMLGLSCDQIKSLQNQGVLDTIKISSSLRYVSRGQVIRLLQMLQQLPETLPNRSVFPLRFFCHWKQVSIVRMVELWSQGKIDGMLCRGEGIGLHAIEVDWSLLSDKEALKLCKDPQLTEVAKYLKINVRGIRHLRDAGFLDAAICRNPDTRHLKQFISRDSIATFERRYVTLGQLANKQGMRPMHLALKLDRENVEPINCSAGHVRVYSKLELARIGYEGKGGAEPPRPSCN